jgi:type II secretory pathway pseudopilin PulG
MNLLAKQNLGKRQTAFTLIDVVVGMGILGIVCLSLFASFTFGFTLTKLYRQELRATQILQEKTEAIRLYTWTQINNSGSVPRGFKEPLTSNGPVFFLGKLEVNPITLTNTTYSTNLRQIVVTVSWTNNNVKRSRTNTTYVSQYGLQDYVFPQ